MDERTQLAQELVRTLPPGGLTDHVAMCVVMLPQVMVALKEFVEHYPGGINPDLDEAYRKARIAQTVVGETQ
jgi:hypothetical protein